MKQQSALSAINELELGNLKQLKNEKWLMYLYLTKETNVNVERVSSLDEIRSNYVLQYVKRTLMALGQFKLNTYQHHIIEESLKWAEVAKTGLPHHRNSWSLKGYHLYAHNIGSAQIYREQSAEQDEKVKQIIFTLIKTHGLIGQYIRGEVPLLSNLELYELINENLISADELQKLLIIHNECIISAVDRSLWQKVRQETEELIDCIVKGNWGKQYGLKEQLKRLRTVSIQNGEDFQKACDRVLTKPALSALSELLKSIDLWYVEAALFDFTFEEFVKILLLIWIKTAGQAIKEISFQPLMQTLYYQHEGKKRVQIYKKRIIEHYLGSMSVEDILLGKIREDSHVECYISDFENEKDMITFQFIFSPAAEKLTCFCADAEKSGVLYEQAVILLFDLFGWRKDAYDRFYEEEKYLATMNRSIDYKKVILDYVTGDRILDIGPGGGALLDLLEERFPEKSVSGVDIAQNVLDALKKKKQLEGKHWGVLYGDALSLNKTFEQGSVHTIIFCSILHELFSYIEFEGQKFNFKTLAAALRSAFDILAVGGRIIIRDGIMSTPEEENRIIRFLSEEGLQFLKRYAKDFKGRDICYEVIGHNEVLMKINDAMEYLYTYTWGEKSYVHEVNEQFGYFTPEGYKEFIHSVLGTEAHIIEEKHYLQEGYTIALSQKIELFDEQHNPVCLPDSTCLIVIEKSNLK